MNTICIPRENNFFEKVQSESSKYSKLVQGLFQFFFIFSQNVSKEIRIKTVYTLSILVFGDTEPYLTS